MTDDEIRELISGRKSNPARSPRGANRRGLPKIKLKGDGPTPEELKLQLEVQKRQRENAAYFKDESIAATGAGKTGTRRTLPAT